MKWKQKEPPTPIGTNRAVTKFAFLPTKCGDYTVWLERYFSMRRLTWSADYHSWYWLEYDRITI